jgi:DNA-binding transcriptional LysR family regulator
LLYASPSYLATRGTLIRPDHLGQHDCILQTYMALPSVWNLVSGKRVIEARVRGRLSTNNVSMTLKFAEHGYGVAALSPAKAARACEEGSIRRVTPRRLSGEPIDDANVILNRDKAEEFETADYTCHGGFGVNAESRKLIIARAFAGGE